MVPISVGKLFDLYMDTLEQCGSFLLEMSDDWIGRHVFEAFDAGVTSFLYKRSLDKLFEEGILDCQMVEKSADPYHLFH